MKFVALLLVVLLVSGFVACNSDIQSGTSVTTTYNYIYSPSETSTCVADPESTVLTEEITTLPAESEAYTQEPVEATTQETTAQETTASAPQTTAPVETTTFAPQTTLLPETTTQTETTTQKNPETTSFAPSSDITLNMSVPEANGTMEVDLSEDNEYIQIVVSERDIDSELLVAVYSVPESGQNYVFEFSAAGAENRTAENIRRVYLIDSSGKIAYVSAASSSEAENVSVVENWFNMTVLIKGMIFPAIEEHLE